MRDVAWMDVADAIAALGATGASSSAVHEHVEGLLADVLQRRDAAVRQHKKECDGVSLPDPIAVPQSRFSRGLSAQAFLG